MNDPQEAVRQEVARQDADRTGVPASMIPFTEPPMYYKGDRLFGPPGAFLARVPTDPDHWVLCCPGCGEAGSPREGAHWTAAQGSFDDVTTLTLEPSIAKSCCGWHGWLRAGIFKTA
jgi:hypothetical protein